MVNSSILISKDSLQQNSTLLQSTELSLDKKLILEEILQSLVLIPDGEFNMGCTADQGSACSSNEFPVHKVIISSFYLSNTEVTQRWWKAFMGDNPSSFCRGDNFPVEMISYQDLMVFFDSLNAFSQLTFRLPTEAEWEYCARAADITCNYRFSGSSDPNDVAWTNKNSFQKTRVVKLKAPNHLGLYDMSGNVWEWVADWYGNYTHAKQNDPRGPSSGTDKVIRGGSWAGSPDFCRNSLRHHFPPDYKSSFIGFRIAIDQNQIK